MNYQSRFTIHDSRFTNFGKFLISSKLPVTRYPLFITFLLLTLTIVGVPIVRAETVGTVKPTDSLFGDQHYLGEVGAPSAWGLTTGSSQVLVAVIDTGVDIDHPDLASNIWTNTAEVPGDGIDNDKNGYVDDIHGWDFVNNIPDPRPKFGGKFSSKGINHGTLLSGIIAAEGNNSIGIAGVTWRTKIMPLRALNNRGEGDVSAVVRAIDYAIAAKVDVINLSFVGQFQSAMFKNVIERAVKAGIVIVSASGNDDVNQEGVDLTQEHTMVPTCYALEYPESIIGVASLDEKGQKAKTSNYGSCITLSAPGTNMMTTQVVNYEEENYTSFYGSGWSGTSLATAVVTGGAALLKSLDKHMSPQEIIKFLKNTCDPIDQVNPGLEGKLGCGRINIGKAVKEAADELRNASVQNQSNEQKTSSLMIASEDGKTPALFFDKDGKQLDQEKPFKPFNSDKIPFTFSSSLRENTFLVFGAGKGSKPLVRVTDQSGTLQKEFLAYDEKFRGGVSVALGDVDGDGEEDIITAPGPSGGPHIRIFSLDGQLKYEFFAGNPKDSSGLRVVVGDVNDDGIDEILVTEYITRKPHIRIYNAFGTRMNEFSVTSPRERMLGVSLTVGDTDNDGHLDIVTAPSQGVGPVKIFSSIGVLKKSWFPFGNKYKDGIALSVGDLFSEGVDRIIAVQARGTKIPVKLFDFDGKLLHEFSVATFQKTWFPRVAVLH